MYIILALGQRGLFSCRTPMEHHAHTLGCAHPNLESTEVGYQALTSHQTGSSATTLIQYAMLN
jgi:hypothetical protein